MKRISALFLLLFFASICANAQSIRFAAPAALTTASGSSWTDPLDLQTAISNSAAGDFVFALQGTYQLAAGSSFSMKEGVKIYGGFAGTETSLSERNLPAGTRSILKGNGTRVVYNNNNGLTADALMDGFVINTGTAPYGAGITNVYSSPSFTNCDIAGNTGGGIYCAYANSTFTNCVIIGNNGPDFRAKSGGVALLQSPGAKLINCLILNNTGPAAGGIVVEENSWQCPLILNCNIIGNTATDPYNSSGGVFSGGFNSYTLKNCIVWGNNSGIKFSPVQLLPTVLNCIVQKGYLNNWSSDPKFVNAASPAGPDNLWFTSDDGLQVQTGSPAINTGSTAFVAASIPAVDFAGATRIQGNNIDIGAYESNFSCNGPATLYVDSSVTSSGDGSSWSTAYKTIDEALLSAINCINVSSIHVAKGTYKPTMRISFSMLNNVTIYGAFPTGGGDLSQRDTSVNKSLLQGNNNSIFYNDHIYASAVLDGFRLSNGGGSFGGGINNQASSPVIRNCIFSENAVTTVYNRGGGGAGIYNANSNPLISHCIFRNNQASYSSAAICLSGSSAVIEHCIFENNTATYGGAIELLNQSAYPTNVLITNSIFSGNSATDDGGAIVNVGTTVTLNNVTFVNNTAADGGGAFDHYNDVLNVNNCIFWGNTANTFNDIWNETGTVNIQHSLTQEPWAGVNNITGSSSPFINISAPAGADGNWLTADDGLRLASGSAVIDAGTTDTTGLLLGDFDIMGNARITGAAIDPGAYEFDNTSLPVTLTDFTGILRNGNAYLKWKSELEINFNHFEIEKSTDRSDYKTIGVLSAKGNGSSYNFSIPQKEPAAYYRLKIVDNNATARHSRIIRLTQNAGEGFSLFPNPAPNYINVQVSQPGIINIISADGKLMKQQSLREGVNIVDLGNLLPGVYFASMNGQQLKFIKR